LALTFAKTGLALTVVMVMTEYRPAWSWSRFRGGAFWLAERIGFDASATTWCSCSDTARAASLLDEMPLLPARHVPQTSPNSSCRIEGQDHLLPQA
jgi:hypothetical protein